MAIEKIPAVVLAAGFSSRMGGFKPLMKLGGRSLLARVLDSLEASGAISETIIVIGHRGEEIRAAVDGKSGVRVVVNEHFATGEMLSSVKAGIGALGEGVPGFVLAFADQPAVLPGTIRVVVERFFETGADLVLPVFGGKKGHPLVMSGRLMPEILNLGGQSTLREVVQRHLGGGQRVEVEDPSVLEDLDTPEDFARAEKATEAAERGKI